MPKFKSCQRNEGLKRPSMLQISGQTIGKLVAVSDMHQRKAEMARQADAFIALPGAHTSLLSRLEPQIFASVEWMDRRILYVATTALECYARICFLEMNLKHSKVHISGRQCSDQHNFSYIHTYIHTYKVMCESITKLSFITSLMKLRYKHQSIFFCNQYVIKSRYIMYCIRYKPKNMDL